MPSEAILLQALQAQRIGNTRMLNRM